jgi:hypothetical protein
MVHFDPIADGQKEQYDEIPSQYDQNHPGEWRVHLSRRTCG